MEKRYQVFISSTFQDLKDARQEVSQALLRANCFPAGMELFPAADEEQFEYIKSVIDASDYYMLITAGRYGSIHPETGLSYTEMEYDYAVETGKPVIRLLHKDPFNALKGQKIERSKKGRKALEDFRTKLKTGKLVAFWSSAGELQKEALLALTDIQERRPTDGWTRSSNRTSDTALVGKQVEDISAAYESALLEIDRIKRKLEGIDEDDEGADAAMIAKCKGALEHAENLQTALKPIWTVLRKTHGDF